VSSQERLLRQIQAETQRLKSAKTAPVVVWAGLNEKPKAFAARVARSVPNERTLVLAVVPHGYTVPARAKAVELPVKAFRAMHPARKTRDRALSGGRGSAKSWSIARVLILTALSRPVRVLCAREFQKSISESSHRLLSDQIEMLGLGRYFDVKAQSITSHCGAEFIFEGLHANVSKIKSLEGIDIAWVEEAAKVTQNSWDTLIPTIRKSGSEIWANFNPEDETDPTYQRYCKAPPPGAVVDHMTWLDNPWFPEELERERVYLLSVDPDAHAHVWEGKCRTQSEAQIFRGKYVIDAFEPAADWSGPYLGADWGFAQDPTAFVKCWVHGRTLYVEYEAYGIGVDIDATPKLFDQVPNCAGQIIRADSARPETISYMQRHGYPRVTSVAKWSGSVEDGIAHLRQYEKIVIHPRCQHLAEEMRLYSYKVDKLSGNVLADVVDKHNHMIDALRYAVTPLIQKSKTGLLDWMQGELDKNAASKSVQPNQPRKLPHDQQPGVTIRPIAFTGWGHK
jgi:phage terminase large subunit